MKPKILISWSGGKDCALALWKLCREARFEVAELLTTYVEGEEGISGHGTPLALIELQAAALGLPLRAVGLPPAASNQAYEQRVGDALRSARARGVYHAAFGDLFLADIRAYREQTTAQSGVTAHFPLWGQETARVAREFLLADFQALVVAVDLTALPGGGAGCPFDEAFLSALPAGVDPCGEQGEFHTFVTSGPIFLSPLATSPGRRSTRGRYELCELLPKVLGEPLE